MLVNLGARIRAPHARCAPYAPWASWWPESVSRVYPRRVRPV